MRPLEAEKREQWRVIYLPWMADSWGHVRVIKQSTAKPNGRISQLSTLKSNRTSQSRMSPRPFVSDSRLSNKQVERIYREAQRVGIYWRHTWL